MGGKLILNMCSKYILLLLLSILISNCDIVKKNSGYPKILNSKLIFDEFNDPSRKNWADSYV